MTTVSFSLITAFVVLSLPQVVNAQRLTDTQVIKEASLMCESGNLQRNTQLAYKHWSDGWSKEKSRKVLAQGRTFPPGSIGEMELRLAIEHGFSSASRKDAVLFAFSQCVTEYSAAIRKQGR